MSDEQVGKYIRLLCAQHQIGHLSEEDMLKICKTYDKDVLAKFSKDPQGNFYNERLESEILRRKAYSESRRQNRMSKKKKNICQSYEKHMENETENENENPCGRTIRDKGKALSDSDISVFMGDD